LASETPKSSEARNTRGMRGSSQMTVTLHKGDLPPDLDFGASVAIDTETMGLLPRRDRLCVVQLSSGDGSAHLVQFAKDSYSAPNLCRLLTDPAVLKIFHYGRFDIATLLVHLGALAEPVYCTKIASKLIRTYTDRHGLRDLCRELIGVDLCKQQQISDWGQADLSAEQRAYAASDVLYLHRLKAVLDSLLEREDRVQIAQACFRFLPTRARLDLMGWLNEGKDGEKDKDLFSH
jgi:ribonuclease D